MKNKVGSLICHTGTMFSGKTTHLLSSLNRYMIAKRTIMLFKPVLDNRYSEEFVVTHDGKKLKTFSVNTIQEIIDIIDKNPNVDVIGIDEVQFFNEKNAVNNIIRLVENYGKIVVVAGLDMDSNGKPFGIVPYLMAMSDEVYKYKAVCSECGNDSIFEYRLDQTDNLVKLGGVESYVSLCRQCRYNKLFGKE